ncbi:hypothetical protein ACGC1H_004008 [Rhizoctonia solani]
MAPSRRTRTRASASIPPTGFPTDPPNTPPHTNFNHESVNLVVPPIGPGGKLNFSAVSTPLIQLITSLFQDSTRYQASIEDLRSILLETVDLIDRLATSNNISIAHQCTKSCIYSASVTKEAFRDVEVMVRPPTPTPRSYAEVACSASLVSTDKPSVSSLRSQPPKTLRHDFRHAPPHTPTHSSKGSRPTTSSGKAMRKPVRVVIDFRGSPPVGYFDTPLTLRFRQLDESARSCRRIPRPLGLHRNKRGNSLVSFPDDTPLDKLRPCLDDIKQCLGISLCFKAYPDVPWAKLHLANIPVRDSPDSPVYSEKALEKTLRLNPAIKDLHIVSPAKWIRPSDKITGTRTSAVLVFEDPDGSITRQLIKAPIFAFGSPITVKRWHPAPPVKAPEQPASGTAMDTE